MTKSSDCVSFSAPADASSAWRQVWRLLQKVTPLWQELALEFWALPLVSASWHSFHIYAPLPGVPHRGFRGGSSHIGNNNSLECPCKRALLSDSNLDVKHSLLAKLTAKLLYSSNASSAQCASGSVSGTPERQARR